MDITKDKKPIEYIDSYRDLPADVPFGHPHIIDLERLDRVFDAYPISIADLVVTILFKFKPGALRTFLDVKRPRFHYIHVGCITESHFCIKRDGRTVTIGLLHVIDGWEEAHKYFIDKESTEPWTPIVIERRDENPETNIDKVLGAATDFAYDLIRYRAWREADKVEVFCGLSVGRSF